MRADRPLKTRFQLLGRCPFDPGEVVPMGEVPGAGAGAGAIWRTGLGPGRRNEPAKFT